ncbi:hypothetical protein M0R45_027317 [Rubus argutus]|uniref:Uncharacterized protein n=1 Tax=Rubus argutus TaxID=59490 RepID=A0AAW1X1U9_RUBAR
MVKETNDYEVQNQDQFQHDQDYYPEPYPDLLDFDEAHYSLDELVAAPTPHVLSSLESNEFQSQKDQSSYEDGDNFNLVSNDQSYDSNNFGLVSEDQLYDFSLVSNEFQGLL